MPSKYLRALAEEHKVPITKYVATTLGIFQEKGVKKRRDSSVREGGFHIARTMNIVYKNTLSQQQWDAYLRRCANEIDALSSIKEKFNAHTKDNKQYPEVYASLDEFLSEALRRRRDKTTVSEPTRRSTRKRRQLAGV